MRLSVHRCLFWMLLFVVHDLCAQIKVIEVDSSTGLPNGKLPFDESFILKLPVAGKRARYVSYIQLNRNHNFQQALNSANPIVNLTSEEIGIPKKVGSKYYLFAQFKNPHLLSPGRQYTVFWTEDVSDKVMDLFDAYDDFRSRGGAAASLAKAQTLYDELAKEYKQRIGVEVGFTSGNFNALIPMYYANATTNIGPNYNAYLGALAAFNGVAGLLTQHTVLNANVSIKTLQTNLANPTPLLDKSVRKKYLPEPQKAIAQLQRLLTLTATPYQNLLKGIEDINCNACSLTSESHIEERTANLATTLAAVEKLHELALLLQAAGQAGLGGAVLNLEQFRDDLRKLKKQFDEQVLKNRKGIRDGIFTIGLAEPRRLNGDTYVPVFETRTKMSITPDLGVITTRIGNDGRNPYSFVPYLGFHINLRPINRDVPFWSYKHKPLHYFSLLAGVSMVSLDNGPKQSVGADSVRSFFGKTSGTLVTGLGVRLGNVVRLTAGRVWYFHYLQNEQFPEIYNRRRLKSWPFVGISLDLAIKDLLNGISDAFKVAPRRIPAVELPETTTAN